MTVHLRAEFAARVQALIAVTCELPALKLRRTVKLTRGGRVVATGTQEPGTTLRIKPRKGAVLTPGVYGLVREYRNGSKRYSQRRLITLGTTIAKAARRRS